jgi:hypothetical protein
MSDAEVIGPIRALIEFLYAVATICSRKATRAEAPPPDATRRGATRALARWRAKGVDVDRGRFSAPPGAACRAGGRIVAPRPPRRSAWRLRVCPERAAVVA